MEMIHDAILGCEPRYELIATLEKKGLGRYVGGHYDEWRWDRAAVAALPEDEAWYLYGFVKGSEAK